MIPDIRLSTILRLAKLRNSKSAAFVITIPSWAICIRTFPASWAATSTTIRSQFRQDPFGILLRFYWISEGSFHVSLITLQGSFIIIISFFWSEMVQLNPFNHRSGTIAELRISRIIGGLRKDPYRDRSSVRRPAGSTWPGQPHRRTAPSRRRRKRWTIQPPEFSFRPWN